MGVYRNFPDFKMQRIKANALLCKMSICLSSPELYHKLNVLSLTLMHFVSILLYANNKENIYIPFIPDRKYFYLISKIPILFLRRMFFYFRPE